MPGRIQSLKVEVLDIKFPQTQYSMFIRLGCPWCKIDTTHKSRVYKSLKSLLFHISQQHSKSGSYYPFSPDQINSLMQLVALSLEWGLLK